MKEKVKQLLSQMTLQEKAALCGGADFWHIPGVERLGIAPAMVADGPHGLRKQNQQADHLGVNESIPAVCFPAGCASACSFDRQLMHQMGQTLGQECQAEGVDILLGPAINIKRSPLCGRNFEYYSEDPYLAGQMSASYVQGVQSQGVGACPKHFAANSQEYRRMTSSSDMSQRTLREIYLPAFEQTVRDAQPWSMMCSYNRLNGTFVAEHSQLLQEILREEWGFEGFVMSDWGAVNDKLEGLKAGLELEMPGPCKASTQAVVDAVQSGKLDQAVLDRAAGRILDVLLRRTEIAEKSAEFDHEKDHALAVEVAIQSAVLLKNSSALPLKSGQKVAYIGPYAKKPRFQGGGSSHIHSHRVDAALDYAPENVCWCEGFSGTDDSMTDQQMNEAIELARASDVAVIFAGMPDSFECEGYDRSHMRLPDCQNRLIAAVASVQPNTVVVLHLGSPVETPWMDDPAGVNAVLCMYLGGQGVGLATHRLLYGEACPSGRLAESWPLRLEDTPCYLNYPTSEEHSVYAEGVFVGYRYYDSKRMPVRWPFGHGESYTQFDYSDPEVEPTSDGWKVSVKVTNTGACAGAEVVQLYLAPTEFEPTRPVQELKGFEKLHLEPGQTKTACFVLDKRSFAYYDEEMQDWYAPSGRYEIRLAHSSRDIRCALPVDWVSKQTKPMVIHRNTPMAPLLACSATAQLLQSWMPHPVRDENSSKEAAAAITDEMIHQMMLNQPLRALQAQNDQTDQWLADCIAQLQAAWDGTANNQPLQ